MVYLFLKGFILNFMKKSRNNSFNLIIILNSEYLNNQMSK